MDSTLFNLYVATRLRWLLGGLRFVYAIGVVYLAFLGFVGIDEWFYYSHALLQDFGLDITPISLVNYSINTGYSAVNTIDSLFDMLLPSVYADELPMDLAPVHPSFQSIYNDKSPGGVVVQN